MQVKGPIPQEAKAEKKEIALAKEAKQLPEEGRKEIEEKTTQSASQEKEVQFKEPVLLWEREFNPPLIDISDQNSAGEYIAIQGGNKDGRPTKILFLDNKGKTIREIPLDKKEKRKIPPEQVWLTYYGDRWDDEKFKKSFTKGKEIETATYEAFVSGNGEYFGIVTQDTKWIDHEYLSPWYEFAYYDKKGKLLWKMIPKDNYGFNKAHISYDGSRVLIIDQAILDYFGQRWYLYDEKGDLIKDEDHNLMIIEDPVKVEKERGEWLEEMRISRNSKYIGYIKGEGHKSKAGLMDGMGNILWEEKFDERQYLYDLSNNGDTLISTNGRDILSINSKGKLLWKTWRGSKWAYLSKDGKYLLKLDSPSDPLTNRAYGWDVIYLFDNKSGNLILETSPDKILGDSTKRLYIVDSISFLAERFLLISFHEYPGGHDKKSLLCLYDIVKGKVILAKENVGGEIRASGNDIKIIDLYAKKYRGQKIKIYRLEEGL